MKERCLYCPISGMSVIKKRKIKLTFKSEEVFLNELGYSGKDKTSEAKGD
ncbi:MAG: hypothetical protein ABIK81_04115 [candidate division WOR-3 bacterium]